MLAETSDPVRSLHLYPNIFRKSLEADNRMCLCSFMAAEYDDLPEAVKKEVQTFADVNVAWLSKVLSAAAVVNSGESEQRARAIFAAVAGAQLMARSRSDISLFDSLIESYRVAGLLPEQTVQSSISSELAKKLRQKPPVAKPLDKTSDLIRKGQNLPASV
jgi:TetR/AcrR family transcriptional repressor of nem operon